ncbi:hypothetical protein A0H81_12015 [Grifola frondosa]|uniref:Uncharacterized protein n=1 Tax=Grifola frondosa TaxID=5627 RepID=A0A1C7LVL8_GRIFR|nr:hypothetical protein A0H81_12015 [Grifola frondosa]
MSWLWGRVLILGPLVLILSGADLTSHRRSRASLMGASNFTPAEVTWLQEQYATQEVRELLKAEARGCLKAIATLLTTRYTADFRDCLPAETDAEFAKRRANKTLAEWDELVQKHAETTDARAERLRKQPR